MSPRGAASQWRSVTVDVGQRLCECLCSRALELIAYSGNFLICLFCEDDPLSPLSIRKLALAVQCS